MTCNILEGVLEAVEEGILTEDEARTFAADSFNLALRFAAIEKKLADANEAKKEADTQKHIANKKEKLAAEVASRIDLITKLNAINPDIAKAFVS